MHSTRLVSWGEGLFQVEAALVEVEQLSRSKLGQDEEIAQLRTQVLSWTGWIIK